jgi:hypothetical protein
LGLYSLELILDGSLLCSDSTASDSMSCLYDYAVNCMIML